MRSNHLWLRYHNLMFPPTCVNNTENSGYISVESVQRWKPNVSVLGKKRWTAVTLSHTALYYSVLNSSNSEKIRAHQLWNSAHQRWYCSCSLNQRCETSNLWICSVQLIIFGTSARVPMSACFKVKFCMILVHVKQFYGISFFVRGWNCLASYKWAC